MVNFLSELLLRGFKKTHFTQHDLFFRLLQKWQEESELGVMLVQFQWICLKAIIVYHILY